MKCLNTAYILSGFWCLRTEELPTWHIVTAWLPQSTVHWPSESFVPASSWPALSVCAHHSSGPSCSPPGWWEHWDRSASPQASTSQGYFLSRERHGVSRDTQESDYKKGQAVQSHGAEHFSWWIALQTAQGKDVFSCTNPTSHQVH